MKTNHYLLLICFLLFNNNCIISQQSHNNKIEEGAYLNLQYDFDAASDILTDFLNSSNHTDSIFLAKFHLAHTRLWKFDFDDADCIAGELNNSSYNSSKELYDRIRLINPIIKAHKREFLPALLELKDVLETYQTNNGVDHPDWYIWKPYLAFLYHFSQSDFEESAKLYDLYVEEFENQFPEGVNMKWTLQVLQALLYYYQDDKKLAMEILKSIKIECTNSHNCTQYFLSYIYRCLSYFSLEGDDPAVAWTYVQEGLQYSNSPYTNAKNNEMIGLIHTYNQKLDLGEEYHQKALTLFSKFGIQEEIVNCIENYARRLKRNSKYDRITKLSQVVDDLPIKNYKSSYGGNVYIPVILYDYYLNLGQYDKALHYLNKSIVNGFQSIKSLSDWEMPSTNTLPIHINSSQIYIDKARLSYAIYLETEKSDLLDKSLLFSLQADSIYNLINKSLVNAQSTKESLLKKYDDYSYFTKIALSNFTQNHNQHSINTLLHFISRTQDIDLALSLLTNKVKSKDKIFKELSILKDSVRQEKMKPCLDDESIYLQNLLNKIEIKQKQSVAQEDYDIDDYSHDIESDKNWITYHYTKDKFIIIVSTNSMKTCKITDLNHNIDSLVSRYLFSLSDPSIEIDSSAQDILKSYIISPMINDEIVGRFTISTSGNLANIPIDLLWHSDIKELPSVSYTYNYKHTDNDQSEFSKTLSIIEPDFDTDTTDEFVNLIYGDNETHRIGKLFKHHIYSDTSATLENLKSNINESQIIHLITHAYQDRSGENKSYIALYDRKSERIKKYGIFDFETTDGSADLVVLSGCETGTGKYEAGLGIQSFAKLFISKGNKSVLSTLWKVNDRSTSMIMEGFYKYLNDGMSKDISLQKAKQDYLSLVDPEYKDPYYWAGLVLTGETSALKFGKRVNFNLIILILITLSIVTHIFVSKLAKHYT